MPSDPTKRSRVLRAHDLMDFVLSDEENGLWFGPRAAPGQDHCDIGKTRGEEVKTAKFIETYFV